MRLRRLLTHFFKKANKQTYNKITQGKYGIVVNELFFISICLTTEAAIGKCSVKRVLLKISQYSQKKRVPESLF